MPRDWSNVQSTVSSQNPDYEPGGGDVTIHDEKLNWNAEAKVDDDNDDYLKSSKNEGSKSTPNSGKSNNNAGSGSGAGFRHIRARAHH